MEPREFTIREFFKEIDGFNYVVQRNWDNLPNSYVVDNHDDLDLFSTNEDKKKIQEVLEKYPEIHCDVRSPEDDYYPWELGEFLLMNKVKGDGFWKPNDFNAFHALYYHNLIHKQGSPYEEKLNKMFKELFPPIRCKDKGVGFYGVN